MFAKTSFDTAGYSFNTPGAQSVAAAPALSFDVTEADFEKAVLERSLEMPVLLDCWAPWCGPCRSLGPVLEKLVQAYGGRFALAKLNTDEAPQISAALQIRSIPLVVLFVGGRPVDQFVGALPEGKIREFLDRHVQPQVSPAEQLRADAAAAPDADTAETLLKSALALEPGHPGATLDLVERLLDRRALDDAQALLAGVPAKARDDRHAALSARLQLALNRPAGDPQALAARIAANGRDFEARFDLAALLAHDGDFRAAFDQLLEVVLRDKGEQRERARKQLVEWFNACPDAEAVSHGRRYLGMYLN
ncbi:MAG TPA: tetratricopeptide repeat protein [Rubrivivax sp.]|nr:tetratricopeptide repeat protein [Rubrivivax sp.]